MKKSAALKKVARETQSETKSENKSEPSSKRAVSRRIAGVSKASRRRPDDADAFLRVREGTSFTKDDLAEELAEGFVGAATSGEGQGIETRDAVVDEEMGGPFVTTPASREFADGTDPSNPEDADREPFPTSQSELALELESEP